MPTNNRKIRNYSAVLDKKYGKKGTPERAKFDDEAYAFYTGEILKDARKSAGVTQEILAERIGADKSYISRIEKGITVPSVATFFRALNALDIKIKFEPTL